MKFIKSFVVLLFLSFIIVGCSFANEDTSSSGQSKSALTVYTTVYPLQYVVEEIGGNTVNVHSVYPPGADGHTYEPTSKEMTEFAKSDAFIYVGEGMESFAESIASALGSQDVELIEIGKHEELFQKAGHSHDDHTQEHDGKEEHAVVIEGLADHYHTGDIIRLTANYNEGSEHVHWHWFSLEPNSEEWEVVEGQSDATYEGEANISEQQIKAVLYDDNHDIIAESNPVTIEIDDHEGHNHEGHDHEGHDHAEHDHAGDDHEGHNHEHQEIAIHIEGLVGHYHTGDTIKLTANYSDGSEYDHWQWFSLEPGSEEWEAAEGQTDDIYEGEAIISGLQIKAVLYDDHHEIVAESAPVTIEIDDHTEHDPHIWTDPLRVIKVAEIVKEELMALNPSEEALYHENFESLKSKLTELDEQFINLLKEKDNKHIIVPHAAFGYWEERYGIIQNPISGLSSEDEPSQKELIEVMEAAKEYDLDYILYEQNSGSRLAQVVQEQIGAEALTIHNLEVRTEEDIENNEDYISLMEYNLEILDKVTK
mgnify:FL=1